MFYVSEAIKKVVIVFLFFLAYHHFFPLNVKKK